MLRCQVKVLMKLWLATSREKFQVLVIFTCDIEVQYAKVRQTKFGRPQGESSWKIYDQMKNYVVEYRMEPENIPIKEEHHKKCDFDDVDV